MTGVGDWPPPGYVRDQAGELDQTLPARTGRCPGCGISIAAGVHSVDCPSRSGDQEPPAA